MQSNSGKQKIVKASIQKEFRADLGNGKLDKNKKKQEWTKRKARKTRHNFED